MKSTTNASSLTHATDKFPGVKLTYRRKKTRITASKNSVKFDAIRKTKHLNLYKSTKMMPTSGSWMPNCLYIYIYSHVEDSNVEATIWISDLPWPVEESAKATCINEMYTLFYVFEKQIKSRFLKQYKHMHLSCLFQKRKVFLNIASCERIQKPTLLCSCWLFKPSDSVWSVGFLSHHASTFTSTDMEADFTTLGTSLEVLKEYH